MPPISGWTSDRSPCAACAHLDEDKDVSRCAGCMERVAFVERCCDPDWDAPGFSPDAVLYRLPTGIWRQLDC